MLRQFTVCCATQQMPAEWTQNMQSDNVNNLKNMLKLCWMKAKICVVAFRYSNPVAKLRFQGDRYQWRTYLQHRIGIPWLNFFVSPTYLKWVSNRDLCQTLVHLWQLSPWKHNMVKEFCFLHVTSKVGACLLIIKAIYDSGRWVDLVSRRDCMHLASTNIQSSI